jgi:hypothetical protein
MAGVLVADEPSAWRALTCAAFILLMVVCVWPTMWAVERRLLYRLIPFFTLVWLFTLSWLFAARVPLQSDCSSCKAFCMHKRLSKRQMQPNKYPG